MAKGNRIELVIDGLPENGGKILLNTFMSQLQNLASALIKIDRDSPDGRATSFFQVTSLSYNSPYRVGLEAAPNKSDHIAAEFVLQRLDFVANALKSGEGLDDLDTDLLENLKQLAKPVGKAVQNITILFNGNALQFAAAVNEQIEAALAVEDECAGAVSGMLEQINLHHFANIFHIFPEVGPTKITCHFPAKLHDDAVSAVGRRVDVFGQLKYRSGASFPHKIGVTGIGVFESLESLPDWTPCADVLPTQRDP